MSAPCCPPTFPAYQSRCSVQFSSTPSGHGASNPRSSEIPSSNRNRAETMSPPTREVNLARHIERTTKSLLHRSCCCSCLLQISPCFSISSLSSRRSPCPVRMVSTLKILPGCLHGSFSEGPAKCLRAGCSCGSFEDGREFPTASPRQQRNRLTCRCIEIHPSERYLQIQPCRPFLVSVETDGRGTLSLITLRSPAIRPSLCKRYRRP